MPTPSAQARGFRLPRGLAPFANRNFRIYWIGFATTSTGRFIEQTGVVWLVYELTHSPVLLGLIGVAGALPALLLSPIAGVVVDRVDLRKLLTITQVLAFTISLILGMLILTGAVELWHIYAAIAMAASVRAFDASARQTLFPRLLPRASLGDGVTLSITAGRLSKLVGPVVGGFAIATLGEAGPFLLNAASFLALMTAIRWIREIPRGERIEGQSFRHELLEGFRHIAAAPVLSGALKMEIIYSLFDLNSVIITIIGRELLGVGPEALGFLLAAPALGSFVGLLWMLAAPVARKGRFGLVATLAYSAALILFATSRSYALSIAALTLIGSLDVLVTVSRNSIMQLAAPGHMRGRVMSIMGLVTRGIGPLSETQSGILAGLVGPLWAIVAAAAAVGIGAAVTARTNRALWMFSAAEPEPVVPPAD